MKFPEWLVEGRTIFGYDEFLLSRGLFGGVFMLACLILISQSILFLRDSPSGTRLVPVGGVQVWWSLFHASNKPEDREARKISQPKKTKLERALTSIGRFALRSQTRRNPSIISFFVALSNEKGQKEITAEELGQLMKDRVLSRHPRFRSRVSKQDDRFYEEISVEDRNQFVTDCAHATERSDLALQITEYLTSKLDVSERLWEAEISTGKMGTSGAIKAEVASSLMSKCDRETVALFRVHHALCDGVSLSIAIGDLCDEGEELHAAVAALAKARKERSKCESILHYIRGFFKRLLFYTVGTVIALSLQAWRTVVSVNPFDHVMQHNEEMGRTTEWRHADSVTEVKMVAKRVSKSATVNDVFVACISSALYRQLEEHKRTMAASGKVLRVPKNINVVIPVHLTGGILLKGQSLGNKIGAFVTAIPERGTHSSSAWLKRVSRSLMEGKATPAALIAWTLAKIMSYGPLAWAKWALQQGNGHSVAVVSNVRGFPFDTHWNGRRLQHLSAFLPLPPGIPIGIVVQSYAGEMSFNVEADKRAVPDAVKFADWVMEEYNVLKAEALGTSPPKKSH